jgi:hypothetical protein
MRNDDVGDLIAQLTRLQVQQTDLLVRLERATDGSIRFEQGTREPTAVAIDVSVTEETAAFAIGDRVKIKNPNPFQADKGAITKIGKRRITVTTTSGQKIVRAAKNIVAL